MDLKGKKIFFIGDSITEGAGTSGDGYRYWDVLAARTGAVCKADGRGGSCIARQHNPEQHDDWNPNIRNHFITRIDRWDADADVVVVFGGVNDFGHGDAPFGSMEDRTDDTFYGALHDLYQRLIEKYPQAHIVVMTPLHYIEEEKTDRWGIPDKKPLLAYVQAIRQVAEFYSLPVLDMYAVSGMQPRVPVIMERYLPDGLHPNDAGHERIAVCVEAFLKTL